MNRRAFLLVFILFAFLDGFALRSNSWGGFGMSSLGLYGVVQLVAILFIVYSIFQHKLGFFFNKTNTLTKPLLLVFASFFVILIQGIVQSLLKPTISLESIINNFIQLKTYFLFFLFVHIFSGMINFRNSYKLLQWLSVLSAVIVIVVLRFHISSTSVKILIGEKEASQFRVMIPTALFITFGFFSFLSQYKFYKKIYLILLSIICLGAIIVQMHRSVLITLILVFFYAIYSLYKFSFRNMYKWIIFLFLFFAIFYFVFNFISISPSQILQNISTSKEEISNNSGDFGIRTFLIIHALHYVIDNYFVFGVGLHWAYISDLNAYIINKFVAGPTYDSGYNNIIIVFGIWGIFIYLYLFISLFKSLFFCIKSAKTYELKSYSYTLLFISIYTFISGYTSDNFLILQAQVTVFILTLALTYSLENNIKQFYDASNSTKTRGRLG